MAATGCSQDPSLTSVGGPCNSDAECSAGPSRAECVTQAQAAQAGYSAPDGYCTAINYRPLTQPNRSCGRGAVCLQIAGVATAGCYATCASTLDCRTGYECDTGICRPLPLCAGASCGADLSVHIFDAGVHDLHASPPRCSPGLETCSCDGCSPDCYAMACVDNCNQPCSDCNLSECASENVQIPESVQNPQNTENIPQNPQNTEHFRRIPRAFRKIPRAFRRIPKTSIRRIPKISIPTIRRALRIPIRRIPIPTECFTCSRKTRHRGKQRHAEKTQVWWKLWQ